MYVSAPLSWQFKDQLIYIVIVNHAGKTSVNTFMKGDLLWGCLGWTLVYLPITVTTVTLPTGCSS